MGRAEVTCHAGCTCEPVTLDGHRVDADRNVSVFAGCHLELRGASASCIVRVRVLEDTSTDGHKFKLGLLTVSTERTGAVFDKQGLASAMHVRMRADESDEQPPRSARGHGRLARGTFANAVRVAGA